MPLTIAVVAHDEKKAALSSWAKRHAKELKAHRLVGTATSGGLVKKECPELELTTVKSGPLGGDQQIGAMIAEGKIDLLIFFPDPLTPMPHDVDVKALQRLALIYNVPHAFNESTADLLVASGFLSPEGAKITPDP